jgi:hypothetical protein
MQESACVTPTSSDWDPWLPVRPWHYSPASLGLYPHRLTVLLGLLISLVQKQRVGMHAQHNNHGLLGRRQNFWIGPEKASPLGLCGLDVLWQLCGCPTK